MVPELTEALGSDIVIHFPLDARPALTEDVQELQSDVGQEALDAIHEKAREGRTNAVARLNPRTNVRTGERIELVVDTHRLHFFDKDTGAAITGGQA